ncbi:hypothetical protein P7K49_026049 [Saguinus oedipus]|uniref:Uncharacterized protein n=1 Tax=Saguinus oedipus TaxID=9490 RepID=A0ABQ9UJR7_SAGOE|nr:hypothetical protein P7K49_026049 [Saguinus oedipus]
MRLPSARETPLASEQFEFALTAVAEEVNAILKALPQSAVQERGKLAALRQPPGTRSHLAFVFKTISHWEKPTGTEPNVLQLRGKGDSHGICIPISISTALSTMDSSWQPHLSPQGEIQGLPPEQTPA